jgi:hypothetical protein
LYFDDKGDSAIGAISRAARGAVRDVSRFEETLRSNWRSSADEPKGGRRIHGLGRPAPRTQSTDRSEPHDRANVARNSLETRRSRLDLDTAFQQGAGRGADRPRPRKCPAPRSQRRIARLAEILLEAMEEIPHDEIQARCSGTILAKWMNFRRQFEEALAFIFCRGSRR